VQSQTQAAHRSRRLLLVPAVRTLGVLHGHPAALFLLLLHLPLVVLPSAVALPLAAVQLTLVVVVLPLVVAPSLAVASCLAAAS